MTQLEVDVTFWRPRCSRSALWIHYVPWPLIMAGRWLRKTVGFYPFRLGKKPQDQQRSWFSLLKFNEHISRQLLWILWKKDVQKFHGVSFFSQLKWYALVFPWFLDQLKCWCEETTVIIPWAGDEYPKPSQLFWGWWRIKITTDRISRPHRCCLRKLLPVIFLVDIWSS